MSLHEWFNKGKKEEVEVKQKASEKNTALFNMMGNFFKDSEWKKYSLYEKSRNFFMINRYMSINYPIQAAIFSRNGMSAGHIVEFWRNVFHRQFKSMPGWIYTKTKKNPEKIKQLDFNSFSEDVYNYYYNVNKCSYKEVNELKEFLPEQLFNELSNIEKMIKSYNVKK